MKQNTMVPIVIVVTAVIAGGGGFFGGMKYQQSKTQAQFGAFRQNGATGGRGAGNGQGGRFAAGGARGGNGAVGDIISKDDKSITVKLPDGSSKIVILSSTTTVNKASPGQASDLAVGDKVAAFGMTNPDGSITAQSVQINPMMRGQETPMPTQSAK